MADHQNHLWQILDPNPKVTRNDSQCLNQDVIFGGIPVDQCQLGGDHALGRHGSILGLEQSYLNQHRERLLDPVPSELVRKE